MSHNQALNYPSAATGSRAALRDEFALPIPSTPSPSHRFPALKHFRDEAFASPDPGLPRCVLSLAMRQLGGYGSLFLRRVIRDRDQGPVSSSG
jgi:hypothetical protein